ncbi:MAG TPA: Zn-dependent alcohol dehydrogenase [Actinocrinis sp.]|uniref:Zn-dependent alcohol dehydrogenase n=1 Tax=Actinocrinis sp. TaxID=1920516 RepID=UPI002DDD18C6|nr:Zn-dependent alcohol dehydrogenase [Actinocrinis sp.]HEV2343157.1 Zn-dependent alcohol dehydrogenase [Actinocrinis sp.]
MRAALVSRSGQERAEVRADVATRPLGPTDVRVRIRASGVCHSDLSAMDGVLPNKKPFVLGHEGAGELVEVGEAVPGLKAADHVVVCWVPPCGHCAYCLSGQANLCTELFVATALTPNFAVDGGPVYGMAGTGTLAEEVVLPWQCAIRVPGDVPFDVAALIGCGVTTGVGAVLNTARVTPGSTVAVIGCGGVGIAAIQGARIAGAADIVAVDPSEAKRSLVGRFGATLAVPPDQAEAAREQVTGRRGFDYVFECVGRGALVRQAYGLTRRGGSVVVVGAGGRDDQVSFSMAELFYDNKRILPTMYGGGDVRVEYDRLIRLWRAGRLDLESMITARLPIERVDEALDLMRAGEAIRTVIEF